MKCYGPFFEIHKDDATQFVVILDNNESFYVPEISTKPHVHKEDSKKTN